MALGRPLQPLTLSTAEREQLLTYTRSRALPQPLVTRARIILRAGDGASNSTIAAKLGLTRPTVGL